VLPWLSPTYIRENIRPGLNRARPGSIWVNLAEQGESMNEKKEKTKALFVRMPESWIDKVKAIAKRDCCTDASVIRRAIKTFLDKKK